MKRESGANPGQSRCCEFHRAAHHILECHCVSPYKGRMGRRCAGNESEDLQNKVKKLSVRGKRAVYEVSLSTFILV